jgi:hypothetical protein
MKRRKSIVKILTTSLLVLIPLFAEHHLASTDRYYSDLMDKYECYPTSSPPIGKGQKPCIGDFNGDGIPGSVEYRNNPVNPNDGKAVIHDGGDLFYVQYVYESELVLSTHLAVYSGSGPAHLIVFDNMFYEPAMADVYVWNGREIAQTQPSKIDADILAAFRAKCERGNNWEFRELNRGLLLIAYYTIFMLVGFWLYRRNRKPAGVLVEK